jgi:hypothetical protein
MSRQIQDQNFLVWEVFPSGGNLGFSTNPYVIFNCLTQRDLRPRRHRMDGDEADAERLVRQASDQDLLSLLQNSRELP